MLDARKQPNAGGRRRSSKVSSDDRCRERSAALAQNDRPDPGMTHGGFLREFKYDLGDCTRTVTGTDANGKWNGFGYVVSHYADRSIVGEVTLGLGCED